MNNLIGLKEFRAVRPVSWLAASAVIALGVVGAVAAAGPGNAAPVIKTDRATPSPDKSGFKHPKLKHGVLTVKGTEASDRITLRLEAGNPANSPGRRR